MTELEIMQHAKDYLDKLAQGIDPLTGQEVPENDVINKATLFLFPKNGIVSESGNKL